MTDHQKFLLKLLQEIDDICQKYHITYYLGGGTTIGAVRHEGFVPWDDDADVLMTRNEWKKFVQAFQKEAPKNRALVSPETDPRFPNMFGRYIDTETTAIHQNQVLSDDPAGVVLDILMLDPVPNASILPSYCRDMMLYSDLVNPYVTYSYRYNANSFRYPLYRILSLFVGRQRLLRHLEKKMFCYSEEESTCYALRWGGIPLISDKRYYGKSRYAKYETSAFQIPEHTPDYLTWHYGDDWMYIPPHDEQQGHVAAHNFEIPYEQVRRDYRPFLNHSSLAHAYRHNKMHMVRTSKKRHAYRDSSSALVLAKAKIELDKKLASAPWHQWMAEEKYENLVPLFADFFKTQLSRPIIGREDFSGAYRFYHPILVKLDDSTSDAAIMALLYSSRLAYAMRYMDIFEQQNGRLTVLMEKERALILQFRSAVSAYGRKEPDSAMEQLLPVMAQWKDNACCMKLYIRLLCEGTKNPQNPRENLSDLLHKAYTLWPEDGEIMKFRGDLYLKQNQFVKACLWYADASMNTRNGITLLEIRHFLMKEEPKVMKLAGEFESSGDRERAEKLLLLFANAWPENAAWQKKIWEHRVNVPHTDEEKIELLTQLQQMNEQFPEENWSALAATVWRVAEESDEKIEARKKLFLSTTLYTEKKELCQQIKTRLQETSEDGGWWELLGLLEFSMGFTADAFTHFHQALRTSCSPFILAELKSIYERDRVYGLTHIGPHSLQRLVQKHGSIEDYESLLSKLGLEPFPQDLLSIGTSEACERKEMVL
ncbi:MAG: phosphorylcholine transferase LicD [Acutalibacteraceae bacterium]